MSVAKNANAKLETTKRCRVCGEKINYAAQKCIHCNSWQDWRSKLGLSSTVLSLLVALIAVIGVIAPVIEHVFVGDNSKVRFSFQRSDGAGYFVFATNMGNRPATVGRGRIAVETERCRRTAGLSLANGTVTEVLQPGVTTILHMKIPPIYEDIECPKSIPIRCSMDVYATNYDGSSVSQRLNATCANIIHDGLLLLARHKIDDAAIASACPAFYEATKTQSTTDKKIEMDFCSNSVAENLLKRGISARDVAAMCKGQKSIKKDC